MIALGVASTQDVIMKLMSDHYSVWQFGVVRSIVAAETIAVVLIITGNFRSFRPNRPGLIAIRGFLTFVGYTCYYVAIAAIPLADAVAIFMVAPLLVTALSIPLLGERVGLRRWTAVVVGFFGILLILRPGFGEMQPALLIALGAPTCYAFMLILTRRIGYSDSGATLAMYNMVCFGLASAAGSLVMYWIAAPPSDEPSLAFLTRPWAVPTWAHMGLMMTTGLVTAVAHYCSAQAYRIAPPSLLAPFEYTYFIWALGLGYLIWGHLPGALTFAGVAIVILSGGYVLRREGALRESASK